jgi:predicted anti-sigma-YlaC factor YlaD
MLSTFEAALLDRHLRRCSSCRAFAASVACQTQLLRGAELEQPLRPVTIPARPVHPVKRGLAGAISACVVAAAAALVLFTPVGRHHSNGTAAKAVRTGAPVLVSFGANPTLASNVDVPRLELRPASIADGPVHGHFSLPA